MRKMEVKLRKNTKELYLNHRPRQEKIPLMIVTEKRMPMPKGGRGVSQGRKR